MEPNIEKELEEKFGKEELEKKINSIMKEYHNLINRESAISLIAIQELPASNKQPQAIKNAASALRPTFLQARVERVFPPRIREKGGMISRSQRVAISDQSGAGTLVVYDSACMPLESEVVCGDLIEAGPVRFRGGEFHLLSGGFVRRVQKGPRMKIDGKNPEFAIGNFEGEVVQFFGDFKYKKGQAKITGESQDALMSSFEILGPGGRARVVVWDSPGLAGKIKKGAYVEIENGQKRGKEIHINSSGRLLIAGIKQQRPTIEKIEIANDESQNQGLQKLFVFASGSKIFQFPSLEEAAICIGGGPIPQGIEPQTIIELKKKDWIGKPVPQEWEKYCKKI